LPAFVGEALAPPPRGAGEIPPAGDPEGREAPEAVRDAPKAVRAGLEAAALPKEEFDILSLLEQGENTVEDLTRAGGARPEAVSGALLQLELKGLVRQAAGGLYEKC
ncbi:MAG: hypothetical protein V3V62_12500, partial [bacterium]